MDVPEDSSTLLFDVWAVANSTRALLDNALRGTGLSAHEFALYSVLCDPGGRTPTELASVLQMPQTTISSVVRRLEKRDHVRRIPEPRDGRSHRLVLTPKGRAAHQRAGKAFLPVLGAVEGNLDTPIAEARRALRSIDDAVRAAIHADQPE